MRQEVPKIVVDADKTKSDYWREVWRYRELLFFFAWRDFLVRYKQTSIGVAWAVLRPLAMMGVLTLVFGYLVGLSSGDIPYPILVFSALLPWQFFANTFAEMGHSLVMNANMISKIYFPRLVVPAGALAVGLVDFLISCILLAGVMVLTGFTPGIQILLLPFFLLIAILASLGAGLWVAALNVRYRDFRHVIPFVVQFGLYISPVGFSSRVVPEDWRLLYSLNPMVGVIDGFRWCIIGDDYALYFPGLILSIVLVLILLASGIHYFRKTETTFADVI